MKKICFFGIYDKNYSRNRILIRGFAANEIGIVYCDINPREVKGFKKYTVLYKKWKEIKHISVDAVVVAFPGQTVMWLAKLLFFRKPIIFDAFISLYDSNVLDRKLHGALSIKGFRDYFLDWYSVRLANIVISDTHEHISYFVSGFNANRRKFIRVPVGIDPEIFYPRQRTSPQVMFDVYFHGSFIPLQGVQYIIDAAEELRGEGISFTIIGNGQEFRKIRAAAEVKRIMDYVHFIDPKPLEELPAYIANADICLGIFGDTAKTQRVIPNKVYECLAMEKPIITADTPAIRELLTDGKNVILCKAGDGEDLARKIRMLKENANIRHSIAQSSYELAVKYLTPSDIVKELMREVRLKLKK